MDQKLNQKSPQETAEKLPQGKKKSSCFKVCALLFFIIIVLPIALIGGFFYFRSAPLRRSDEQVLKTYQPTPEIAEIVEKNAFTDRGKATFYRADPQFVKTEKFIDYCRQVSGGGIEALACIVPKPNGGPFGGRQIFLLQIDDPNFADHKYSAASHEMLHSAYDRLNEAEKKRVEGLLNQELTKKESDPHLAAIMDLMKKSGKKSEDLLDELHSKIGVEYADISPELEDYYKQYFTDRQIVVKLYREGGFNSRVRRLDELKKETADLDNQMNPLRAQMDEIKNKNDYKAYMVVLSQFNNLVNQYNERVAEGQKVFEDIQTFYRYFNPNYQPPETIEQ